MPVAERGGPKTPWTPEAAVPQAFRESPDGSVGVERLPRRRERQV
ncbi:hypothetical protein BZL30_6145 [Mycobacterium kansasii]|uniref:Uncharacterized protein n=1 Tax=Mycobacterium kansasii TaxID=1768 RepID=A0A1V3X784_MYCKA|nr:hypothetical protein BZL30_6145 [Mycobacterium kansasii]OOK75103.1 hypothetical protein BZL29_4198 [Mycobacterium kansasii]